MRNDFCAFILTHGRPDRVFTYDTLKNAGYTGKIYIVVDDEDDTIEAYRKRFGDAVLVFSKAEVAKTFDEGDNFGDRRTIVYARNVCFRLAEEVECKYFIQLDDDYTSFFYRIDSAGVYCNVYVKETIESLFSLLIDFLESTPTTSIAISQGGNWLGGMGSNSIRRLRRKAMNTFVCSTDKPFKFVGRINEDVNTYTSAARAGDCLFFTVMQAQVIQMATQSNAGGMTDIYQHSGTYVKSFYTVMYAPSCSKISVLKDSASPHPRIHHKINWNSTAPKIVAEHYRADA